MNQLLSTTVYRDPPTNFIFLLPDQVRAISLSRMMYDSIFISESDHNFARAFFILMNLKLTLVFFNCREFLILQNEGPLTLPNYESLK